MIDMTLQKLIEKYEQKLIDEREEHKNAAYSGSDIMMTISSVRSKVFEQIIADLQVLQNEKG